MDNQPAPRLFEALIRYKWSSLCLTLVIVAISVAVAAITAPRGVVATSTLALKAPLHSTEVGTDITGSDQLSEASFVRYVQQRALFLTSDRVLDQARTILSNPPDLDSLRTEVTATAATSGQSITLSVSAANASQAEGVANAVVESYRDLSRSDATASANQALAQLATQRSQLLAAAPPPPTGKGATTTSPATAALTQELANLDEQSAAIGVAVSQFGDGVTFADSAAAQPSVFGKDLLRDGAIGLALGLVVAAAIAWARADRDRRVRDADDLHATASEPILAEIAEIGWQQGAALPGPNGSLAMPSYQVALTGLRSAVRDGVVVVTAAGPQAGATTSTLHLATVAARDGLRVCVVDADTDTRKLSELLGLNPQLAGFTQLATGAAPLAGCIHNVRVDHETAVWAVAAGVQTPGTTTAMFQSSLLEKMLAELRANYDLVLIDTPPIVDAPEVAAVVRESDAVLVVTRRGVSMDALDRTRDRIKLLDGKIGGYLLTFAATTAVSNRRKPPTVVRGALR
ncbi:MAG TPA: AAA family ATPase [Pseudonocardiaceae bacterium]|jgi:Mrp family chromosome partitioning ATPase|nr:AAA family ATPase [Pseudonocardiaceae bacterium]